MPAPDFDLAVFTEAGEKTTTTEALDSAMQSVLDDVWEQMHTLTSRGLIDTINSGGTGNAITAQLPASHAEVPVTAGGGAYSVSPVGTNTGNVTLSISGETALPLRDADGSELPAGTLASGVRVMVRKSGSSPNIHYRLVFSEAAIWAKLATVGVIRTVSEAGTGNAITAALPAAVAGRFAKALGQIYVVRPPFTNTGGAVTLSIDSETPVRVYDQDNQDPVAGEIVGRRWTFLRYSTSGPQYNLIGGTVTARQLLAAIGGGTGGGGSGDAEPRAEVGAWLDGDVIHVVGDQDGVVADLGDLGLTAISPVQGGKFAGVVVNRPSIGANTYVGGMPSMSGVLIPAAPKILHILIVWGQSLAVGANSAASLVTLSQPWPDDALMFDRAVGADVRMGLVTANEELTQVLVPGDLTGFRTLVARPGQGPGERGETLLEGCVKRLTTMARSANIQHRTLAIAVGTGSSSYDVLKQGTQTYDNMLAAVTRAKALAEAQGWRVIVDAMIVKHGEADSDNAGYAADLAELQDDVDTDFKAITGQTADVHLFLGQPSSFGADHDGHRAMVAADGALIHLVGPDYPFRDAYYTDFVHFNGPGYELIGEQCALALRDQLWGAGHVPTKITAASRSGTTVTLTYQVAVAPLTLDTTTISNPGQWGFRFFAGATEIAVTGATVTDTGADGVGAIQLTLASAPVSGSERVDYALTLQTAPKTLAGVPRGNVRDSAPETSQYDGRRLYRWAPHQRFSL